MLQGRPDGRGFRVGLTTLRGRGRIVRAGGVARPKLPKQNAVLDLFDLAVAQASSDQIVQRPKRAVQAAIRDQLVGAQGTDPFQSRNLIGIRSVQINHGRVPRSDTPLRHVNLLLVE